MSDDAPNNEKEELQAALRERGVTVNDAWEIPALKRKLTMELTAEEGATATELDAPAPKPVKKAGNGNVEMVLLKHYRPRDGYEIVGHHRDARLVKSPAGELVEADPARFVKGEMAPPPLPGVGFPGKVWAGTTIRLPRDEAMTLYDKGIAKRGFD